MWKESGRRKSRVKIWGLIADVRCSQAVLDFLSTADVGRLIPAEEDVGSEVSEWKLQERKEREEERRVEAKEPGVGGESPLFLPTPDFMVSVGEAWAISFVCFLFHFLCDFLGAHHIFLGQAWAQGEGGACKLPRGQRTGKKDCT